MNAGFTAALAGLAEAPPNWERCSQLGDWVRAPGCPAMHTMPACAVQTSLSGMAFKKRETL